MKLLPVPISPSAVVNVRRPRARLVHVRCGTRQPSV